MSPLRILHLEDNPTDGELIRSVLEAAGLACTFERVETAADFQAALERKRFDLILSDFTLPSFDGMSALKVARQKSPGIPFIFVSGTIGEEVAVDSLKHGASDYVLKDRLSRLVASVQRALREAQERAERQRIREELRHRNELFRQISDSVDDLIVVLDSGGRRLYSSRSYLRLLGDPDASAATDFFAEIHPADRERLEHVFRKTVAEGSGLRAEYRILIKDGSIRYIESQSSVVRAAEGRVQNVVIVARDVTDRKAAEQALVAAETKFRTLVEQSIVGIYIVQEGELLYVNPKMGEMFGAAGEEMISRPWLDFVVEEDRVLAQENIRQRLEAATPGAPFPLRMRRQDGKVIHAEVHGGRTEYNGRPAIIGTLLDITEKKQIEAQLLRAQRLENIGVLAGGIAHDLNNVLGPILVVGYLLRDKLPSDEDRRMLDTAAASAQRGAEMVKQILSFARGVSGEPVLLQVKHLVNEIVRLARETFPRSIHINTRFPDGLRPITGDATQIHQVLLNLCVNARDAMPEGGTLSLEADNTVLEGVKSSMQDQPLSGPHVVLCVSDTGTGIPAGLLDKIFEPFFTTKEAGKGTGLGLSTVMSIVKSHGGFLEVFSQLGRGTTFKVFLPAAAGTETELARRKPAAPPAGRGELVLLVEDELAILEITKELLESFNYRVLTAADGAEAVTLYRQRKGEVNVVVTDLMMPIMDGPALIRALRQLDHHVKVVAVSGLGSQAQLAESSNLNVQAFLNKPYTTELLMTTLRQVLKAP